jgi:hypothetical protein
VPRDEFERVREAGRHDDPAFAAWMLCLAAGYVSRGRGSAVEPLARLKRQHELRLPSAVQAWQDVREVLDAHGVVLDGGPMRAARWPNQQRVELEQRVRALKADSAA